MSIFTTPLRNTTLSRKASTIFVGQSLNDREHRAERTAPNGPDAETDDEEARERSEDESAGEDEELADVGGDDLGTARPNRQAGKHRSLRYQHIDVLVTLIHKCILDSDWIRAERAYSLLLRCKGIDIRLCYDLGLEILNHTDLSGRRSAELLSRLIIAYPPLKSRHGKRDFDRADKFVKLLVEHRIHHKQFRLSMQELDGWLLVPPYKDDRQLWKYRAMICEELEDQARTDDNQELVKLMKTKRKQAMARAIGEESNESDDSN